MTTTVSEARALTALLSYSPGNVSVGREVVAALRTLGRGAVPSRVRLLLDGKAAPLARMAAARLLGQAGGEEATRALYRASSATYRDVAAQAQHAVSRLAASPRAAQPAARGP